MRVDFSAMEGFLEYLAGDMAASELLQHPAYRTVSQHARLAYGIELLPEHFDAGVAGKESPFFGLREIRARVPLIEGFVAKARHLAPGWIADCRISLAQVADPADLETLVIYPIAGYDVGIGLAGAACLNVNWPVYLDEPAQFGYMAIHECCHVLYSSTRPMPTLASVTSPREWYGLLSRMTQDEGFAVYTPLRLRQARGDMGNSDSHPIIGDYAVLADESALAEHLAKFVAVERKLAKTGCDPLSRDEYLELIFGPDRLTYRVGCEIIRRIEKVDGAGGVRRAFNLPGESFLAEAGRLVGITPIG